ncbi:galectin-3-binding protein B [Aulostomus maculatus]
MLPRQNPLWLLLLLHVSESAFDFNMLKKSREMREGDVRLFGSQSPSEGRVEVYHEGKWGTVCDDGWDLAEARVVCRQLNFPGAKSIVTGKDYGQASGPIWLDDIECEGTEDNLVACGFKGWGVTDCTHKEDVGVICESAISNETISDSSIHSLDHSISLSNELGKVFDSGVGCDFLIVVRSAIGYKGEDGTPEMSQTMIRAHKIILSHFPLFNASEGNSNITVTISQSCQPHFTSFIRYIYTRKIDVTLKSAQCFHWLASKFGVKQLLEASGRLFTQILPEDLSFHTQVSLHEYAVEMEDFVLQENCIQYLAWNFQNLTQSPAWLGLSETILGALLVRSDLVVPDEYSLLQTVEKWIQEKGQSISTETQVDLLSRVRFPMISAEKLYELQFNSSLYDTHEDFYRKKILTALQFNVLLYKNLAANPKFMRGDDDYQPRIYTDEPWSVYISPLTQKKSNPAPFHYQPYNRGGRYNQYGYGRPHPTVNPYTQSNSKSFTTPVHTSMIFKYKQIWWDAKILLSSRECSNQGLTCESVPAARLAPQNTLQQSNILFRNRLLLICQGRYICQVQDFKQNLAVITNNGTQVLAYPCPDDQYIYRMVVRPEYSKQWELEMLTYHNSCILWLLLLVTVPMSSSRFALFGIKVHPREMREGDVRLFGSQSPSEGRVEVYHEGKWGTVCDDGWDLAEARVVCRQLNFPGAKSIVIGKDYGQASGPIWLDDIECEGTEDNLVACGFKGWGVTDCTHKEDVGVICESAISNETISDSSIHSLDHSISLSNELGKVFDSGVGCDFLIVVRSAIGYKGEDGTPEMSQTMIRAHKIILSHFPLFNASEGNSNITVTISQSCQPHFTSFIRYIYTRKIDVTLKSAQCFHWLASKFGVKQLLEASGRLFTQILPEDLSFHTQVSLHEYAVEMEDFVLQENCIQYLAWNFQNLTQSPAWLGLSETILGALLVRSDLVVPDEYSLLQTVEKWIQEKGQSISTETQVDLLSRVRFPMISAEKLYELQFNSSLYDTHEDFYRKKILTALQFNVLLYKNLAANPKFMRGDDDYQPRIYTDEPWGRVLRNSPFQHYYYHGQSLSTFTTPVHTSLIFQDQMIHWEADIFENTYECSNRGLTCESVPAARLAPQNSLQQNVLFRNRLLVMCQGRYICQVQDFKNNLAHVVSNSDQVPSYPCADEQYTYHLVVRPEYV